MLTRRIASALPALVAGMVLVACQPADDAADGAASDTGPSASSTTSATAAQTPTAGQPSDTAAPTPQDDMRIQISIADQTFAATLDDSAAGRDLLEQLPLTVEMSDHGGVEKTGRLPSALSTDGQPDGADPDVGDLGYYAPGNDLVLYYGDQSYFSGIVVLGQLEGDAAAQIAAMDGSVTVRVSRLG